MIAQINFYKTFTNLVFFDLSTGIKNRLKMDYLRIKKPTVANSLADRTMLL